MSYRILADIFILIECVCLVLPRVDDAIFQYFGKKWIKSNIVKKFFEDLLYVFMAGWIVLVSMEIIAQFLYGSI